MSFKIINRKYYNSLGEETSKESFESEWQAYSQKLEQDYNKKLDDLIRAIPHGLSEEEKLKQAFLWLANNVSYEHNLNYNQDGSVSSSIIPIYNNWGILVSDKYSPLLLHRTICSGITPVVNDICKRLGIVSQSIFGETRVINETDGTRLKHVWNAITINGVTKHLDVTYAIYNKEQNLDPLDYFLIDDDRLHEIAPHCNYDGSAFSNKSNKL